MDGNYIRETFKNVIQAINDGGGVLKYQPLAKRFIIITKEKKRKYLTMTQMELEEDKHKPKSGGPELQRVKILNKSQNIDIL